MTQDRNHDAPRRFDLTLPAQADLLPRVNAWLEETGLPEEAPQAIVTRIELAVEELFLNLAHHAYAGAEGEARLALLESPDALTLIIEDDGDPFNPLDAGPEPDLDMEVEDRAIGGLGLHMVRRLSDRQDYERDGGTNRLTLVFRTVEQPEGAEDAAPQATQQPVPTPKRRPSGGLHAPTARERKGVFFSFFLRILLPVALIMTASLILAAGLNVLRLERAFQDAAEIRYDSVARELSDTIESSFGAGLSLESNLAVQVAIDRSAQLYDGAIRFFVTDPEGTVIHASQGAGDPPAALTAPEGGSGLWHALAPDDVMTGQPLIVQGRRIGTLVLVFPSQRLFEVTAQLRRDIASAAPLVALISLPIIALIALLVMIPFDRRFQHMADVMHDLADGIDRPVPHSEGPLLRAAAAISARLRGTEQKS